MSLSHGGETLFIAPNRSRSPGHRIWSLTCLGNHGMSVMFPKMSAVGITYGNCPNLLWIRTIHQAYHNPAAMRSPALNALLHRNVCATQHCVSAVRKSMTVNDHAQFWVSVCRNGKFWKHSIINERSLHWNCQICCSEKSSWHLVNSNISNKNTNQSKVLELVHQSWPVVSVNSTNLSWFYTSRRMHQWSSLNHQSDWIISLISLLLSWLYYVIFPYLCWLFKQHHFWGFPLACHLIRSPNHVQ